jgi:hypothetical protein
MELTQIQHLSSKALWNQRRTTTKYLLLEHYAQDTPLIILTTNYSFGFVATK